MNQRVRARALVAVVAVVAVVGGALMSPATAATRTGTIKGVVTLDGQPISFAKVQLFRLVPDDEADEIVVGPRLKTDNTDSAGQYSFSGLVAGSASGRYVVLVSHRQDKTVKTYRTVVAKSGKTVTQNVRTKAAATLTGTLRTLDGRSPSGLTVETEPGLINDFGPSYDKLFPEYSTTVRGDGTFTLSGIPSGRDYDQIRVSDGRYAQQCYDFVENVLADCATEPNQDPAYYARQRIDLATGEKRTLPTVTVSKFAPPVSRMTGQVTDSSGKPLKGITVTISSDEAASSITTRSSGRFTVTDRLPAGVYRVRYIDPKNVWASQYLGGGPDKKVRQSITLTPGHTVRGLDTRLKSLSTTMIATKGGTGTAKVAFQIKRKATGSAPSGTMTLSFDGVSKSVMVVKGKATVTLSGLRAGTQSLVADYSGTSSTAGFSKIVKVLVK